MRPMQAPDWRARPRSSRALHRVGDGAAHSRAGAIAGLTVAAWGVLGVTVRFPAWWQTTLYSVTGAVTFVMVFVLQHTQARQTAAMQRKLDELLRSQVRADDALIAVELAPDEELQALGDINTAVREQARLAHDDETR